MLTEDEIKRFARNLFDHFDADGYDVVGRGYTDDDRDYAVLVNICSIDVTIKPDSIRVTGPVSDHAFSTDDTTGEEVAAAIYRNLP